MRSFLRGTALAAVLSFVAIGSGNVVGSASAAAIPGVPGSSQRGLSAPALVVEAQKRGQIKAVDATRFLAYALADFTRLPARFRSAVPFDGTLWLLEVRRRVDRMRPGPARAEILQLLGPGPAAIGTGSCDVISPTPSTDTIESEHFYIEYNAGEVNNSPDGLTIEDYIESLEHAWTREIIQFEWPAPPVYGPNPPPNNKYAVRISQQSPVLYGFVSNVGTHAGEVGDNPNTSWDDQDAQASCMGLNSDYSAFPGSPRRALDATTAHEFNHSIQFGWGALNGENEPDANFVEGGATWMEDEAYDRANDNYNYLYPDFEDDMGEHEGSEYSYWITWRGMLERYGTTRAGGSEDVFQRFWELTSKNEADSLVAFDRALRSTHGTSLADAYHAYSIAMWFLRPCGGAYRYPYCFQEAEQYINGDGVQSGAGRPTAHGAIESVGGSYEGTLPDNYSLNWITLPTGSQPYSVKLQNEARANGGLLRGSVACDTGEGLRILGMPQTVAGPRATEIPSFDPTGCDSVVLAVTNIAQTAPNPDESEDRSYTVTTAEAEAIQCPGGSSDLNVVVGGPGPDVLQGTIGADSICGLQGDDRITGLDGDDVVRGNSGDDSLDGGPGTDTVRGAGGGDAVRGGSGDDVVRGGEGPDFLLGQDGRDVLTGDIGGDALRGGSGADELRGRDGIRGNDDLDGGPGPAADRCVADPRDRVERCP